MSLKRLITILLFISIASLCAAQEAIVLGGANRIKKAASPVDDFLLIEKKTLQLQNGDILKTKSKGYILIRDAGFQIMIYPYSRFIVKNAAIHSYELSYGKVWIENQDNSRNLVTANGHYVNVRSGVSYMEYEPSEGEDPENIEVVTLKGNAAVQINGRNFTLLDYRKVSKNQSDQLVFDFIPIEQVTGYVQEYRAYQGKISGWKHYQLEKEKLLFKPNGSFSLMSRGNRDFVILALQPQFRYKDWKWGLILPFYVDYNHDTPYKPENWGNYSEWDFSNFWDGLGDLALKIDFLTYGEKYRTSWYINAGNLDRLELKNSLIINNFKPNINYPQKRQLTVEASYSGENWGLEGFMADFSSLEIFGARGYYKPFIDHYLFKKLELGLSAVSDTDPQGINDGSGNRQIYLLGLDLNLPIYNFSEIITFNLTSEFADTLYTGTGEMKNARGFGYSYGLLGTFVDSVSYQIGGTILKDSYPDSYFDAFYLSRRQDKLDDLLGEREKNHYGLFSSLNFDFENILKLDFSYRQVFLTELVEDRPKNTFSFHFYLYPEFLDFAYLVISYDRLGIRSFSDFWNEFFSSELSAVNASLRLPFKLKYLELQLNFRRSVSVEEQSETVQTENSYESQIKFVF
jgi:hypothetical protein